MRALILVLHGAQDDELLSAMHIPVDGEQVEVVEVSGETELVDAALTSLGGSASDEMDEVCASAQCECSHRASPAARDVAHYVFAGCVRHIHDHGGRRFGSIWVRKLWPTH